MGIGDLSLHQTYNILSKNRPELRGRQQAIFHLAIFLSSYLETVDLWTQEARGILPTCVHNIFENFLKILILQMNFRSKESIFLYVD